MEQTLDTNYTNGLEQETRKKSESIKVYIVMLFQSAIT